MLILGISCKWNYSIHGLLGLISFTQHNICKINLCYSIWVLYLFITKLYFIAWIYHIASVDGALSVFTFNNYKECYNAYPCKNFHINISFCLSYIPRSGISVSYDDNTTFNNLRICKTVFQSGCITLHFYQQCTRVPISPHLCHCFTHIVWLFDYSPPSVCEVVSRGFDLHFSYG